MDISRALSSFFLNEQNKQRTNSTQSREKGDQLEGELRCNVKGFFVGTILVSISKHDVAMNLWKGKVHESHCCEYRKRKKLNKNYDDEKNLDM
jgi:hypothetical protein|uniref:Uncharacterized protein n=1 Tax=Picea sitchensis TaxID=3332 RepID=A9P047_PICSI|nr:unknown [Picea sitchensis]